MDTLLFIYACVVFGGMAAGIENNTNDGLYIVAILLWPLTLVGILIMLLLDWIGVI